MEPQELEKRVFQAVALAEEAQQSTRAGVKALHDHIGKLRDLQSSLVQAATDAANNAAVAVVRNASRDLHSEAASLIRRALDEQSQNVAAIASNAAAATEAAEKALEAASEAQQGVKWGLLLGVAGVALAVGVLLGVLITRI